MQVTVKLFAGFRKGRFISAEREFAVRPAISRVMEEIGLPEVELGILLCNGRHIEPDYLVQDGDELSFFPKVGGG